MNWWKVGLWFIGMIFVAVGQNSDKNETTKGCYGVAIAIALNLIFISNPPVL